ncbi:MAG: 5'/3'-nucleotidase SurE [Crocinitomicaceae bacterium]|nr:5'/3'-nucleotidase SurE [Crocinitomicaceae bacterium]
MSKPLILVTNDDGISAKGIEVLIRTVQKFGDVVVVAPDKAQSGMGHAITVNHPLRISRSKLFNDIEAYSTNGTPVDCVKLGIYEVLNKKPDLLVSGINHGANFSTNVLYSGTMSAAVEGAMENIPSIGFSLCDFSADADFSGAQQIVEEVIQLSLRNPFPKHVCLNVNIPSIPKEELKGIQFCKQAAAFWDDRFERRQDPFGHDYYWMTGNFREIAVEKDTDLFFIKSGYATIVPTQFDMTAHTVINDLKNWK